MDDLIQGLLEYSRMGRAEPRMEAVDLEAVVADAVAQMRAEIDRTGAEVAVRKPFPRVMASRLPLTAWFALPLLLLPGLRGGQPSPAAATVSTVGGRAGP